MNVIKIDTPAIGSILASERVKESSLCFNFAPLSFSEWHDCEVISHPISDADRSAAMQCTKVPRLGKLGLLPADWETESRRLCTDNLAAVHRSEKRIQVRSARKVKVKVWAAFSAMTTFLRCHVRMQSWLFISLDSPVHWQLLHCGCFRKAECGNTEETWFTDRAGCLQIMETFFFFFLPETCECRWKPWKKR